jgi:hypothetical protein
MRAPNWTADSENPEELVAVNLFPNEGAGFGFGVTSRGIGNSLPEGYDRTINMTSRDGRTLSPSLAVHFRDDEYYGADIIPSYAPSYLVPWETTAGVPVVLFAINNDAWKYQDGAISTETDATAQVYGNAVFHDDGNGTALLYAGTFGATDGVAGFLNHRTQAGVWAEDGDVRAKFIVSAAGALWRTGGDTGETNYKVSKCPAGSNPLTLLSWGTDIQVGTSESRITALSAIGAAPIVFKEDGVYVYIEADDRFENQFRVLPHPFNFVNVTPDGAGGLYTVLADGQIVHISKFGSITAFHPLGGKPIGRDTPDGTTAALVTHGADIYALLYPTRDFVQPSGLTVLKTTDNFSTFSGYSAQAQDGSSATVVDLSSLGTLVQGDALLIGFDAPFLAARFVTLPSGNGNNAILSGAISDGVSTFVDVTIKDATKFYDVTNSQPFGLIGANEIVLDLPSDLSVWMKDTYDGFEKYWLRITTSAAFDSSVTVSEISIVVKRAAPAFATTNNDNAEVWEASGLLAKVLRGRQVGDGWTFDDVYTLPSIVGPGRLLSRTIIGNKLAVVPLSTPNSADSALIVACRDEFYILPLPAVNEPTLIPYPRLARDTTNQLPPAFYPSQVDTEDYHELRFVEAWGQNLTREADSQNVAFRWDDTNEWTVAEPVKENAAVWEFEDNHGRFLSTAYQLLDSVATDPVGPSCLMLRAWIKPYGSTAERVPYNPEYRPSPPPPRATVEVS